MIAYCIVHLALKVEKSHRTFSSPHFKMSWPWIQEVTEVMTSKAFYTTDQVMSKMHWRVYNDLGVRFVLNIHSHIMRYNIFNTGCFGAVFSLVLQSTISAVFSEYHVELIEVTHVELIEVKLMGQPTFIPFNYITPNCCYSKHFKLWEKNRTDTPWLALY